MKIDIDSPMVSAHRAGIDTYTPVFYGIELEVECGNPAITLRNLEKITGRNREPVAFQAAHGRVLVVFDSGETYLATGFSYGSHVDEVLRFAEFAAKHDFGDLAVLRQELITIDSDWVGQFPMFQKEHEPESF